MKYNNTVIKVKNIEHGAEVIQWWKDQGVDTCSYLGSDSNFYYGLINNKFAYYTLKEVQVAKARIIELPNELPQRGDEILVWDYDEKYTERRIFLTYIEGAIVPILCVDKNNEDKFKCGQEFYTTRWKHWKPIPKEELVELTVEDISNGKGVGVKPELIRIKK
jgi:hypothetical protein